MLLSNYYYLLCLLIVVSCNALQAQTWTWEMYKNALNNHPLLQIQQNNIQQAQQEIQQAKAAFDPTIGYDLNAKYYNDKAYFLHQQATASLATNSPVELKTGYNNSDGVFLNPENITPNIGVLNIGASIDILQGFITDKRRTYLNTSKQELNNTENERLLAINKMKLEAYKAYNYWYYAYQAMKAQDSIYTAATARQVWIKQAVKIGEYAAIDTLEGSILVQDRLNSYYNALYEERNARLLVGSFLWNSKQEPVLLNPTAIPTQLIIPNNNSSSVINPLLQKYSIKESLLNIELKLKKEYLKPKLKLNYAWLYSPNYSPDIKDSKWSINFSYPIFTRAAKAEVEQYKLKLKNNDLEAQLKANEIRIVIENLVQELAILQQQQSINTKNINNTIRLLNLEIEKYQLGEGSVFLVNSREIKLIEYIFKKYQLLSKINKNKLEQLYYTTPESL